MRIYADIYEATREIERDLVEMGIYSHSKTMQNKTVADDLGFATKELMGYSYSIPIFNILLPDFNPGKLKKTSEYLNKDFDKLFEYCIQEIGDRICNAPNPGLSHKIFPEVWEEFLNELGKFDYTYGERYHMFNQYGMVIEELQNNLESRRAVLSVFDIQEDVHNRMNGLRIPCSMYYQFLVRNVNGVNKLSVIYNMRSCDFYLHWINDVVMTMMLAALIANRLQIELGDFIHQIGSFHAYRKDYETRGVF